MRTWNLHHTYVVGLNKGSTHLFSRQSKKAFIYNKILIEIHSNRKVWTLDFSSKSQSFTQSMERNQVMLSITPDNVWWMWVGLQREKHRERGRHSLSLCHQTSQKYWRCESVMMSEMRKRWRCGEAELYRMISTVEFQILKSLPGNASSAGSIF